MEHESTSQLFSNPLLEKLSHTNAFSVIIAFLIISLTSLIVGVYFYTPTSLITLLIPILGWLCFTLIEYSLHRFAYHSGEYRSKGNWQHTIHGIHHDFPTEKDRLAMPLVLAIIIASCFFGIFYKLLGKYTFTFFSGFVFGHSSYLFIHYKVHTSRPPNNYFKFLWTHHHIHHYQEDDRAFGVTTRFWDIVFNTMPLKDKKP